ncbi:MAG: hypothetical protein F4107_09090 [Gemmatimonadetes bacterium]|nr:hypothetical protein [Gemmatimonadota bacterium]MYI66070.1 hypothetical protein [Gemmatimonadota bacterium]
MLLENAASQIVRELRDPFDETIRVVNVAVQEPPRALYRGPHDVAYTVNLTAKDRHWAQFAYQFAHEFCHVLSGHERLRDNPNNWLHEAICELGSLFVLRRMGKRWDSEAPYPNWISYSQSLTDYAVSVMEKYRRCPLKATLGAWLSANEEAMRSCPYLRDKNGVVALRLLPVFEEYPHGWNAVRMLPPSTGRAVEYIEAWKASVGDADRSFVEHIGTALTFYGRNPWT